MKGDLVLVYDHDHDKIGVGKLEPFWDGPWIMECVLQKGAYEVVDYDGNPLLDPQNGFISKNTKPKSHGIALSLFLSLSLYIFIYNL